MAGSGTPFGKSRWARTAGRSNSTRTTLS